MVTGGAGIADVLVRVAGGGRVAFTAYDGSRAGDADAPVTLHVRSEAALRSIVTAPGELGLARAYVSGALDVEGDLYTGLSLLTRAAVADLSVTERSAVLRALGPRVLRPLAPPLEERPGRLVRGLRVARAHTRRRDAEAISHHYDVSNEFYARLLGPSMAYTCAVYPRPDATLEEAQTAKVDLICRKLGLRSGMRLLDVGCGWGTMVRHAAREYGVSVLGVTLSRAQAEWNAKAIAMEGLTGLAEVRHADYRDITEGGFDAVSSIGLTEHIGIAQYPTYVAHLRDRLRPGGRLLNHTITRHDSHQKAIVRRGFIARYVFPDGELPSPAGILGAIHDGGLEVRHSENLREHYAMTLRDWCANLDATWDEAVGEVGEATARVWALYLAGSRLAFEADRIELHQVLATKTTGGVSGMALRPDW